jgi:uncharacterized damage-inducible protein DinB
MNATDPLLQKPGAGLPWVETLLLRYWHIPRLSKKMSWDECDRFFVRECQRILTLIENVSSASLKTKVLVDPLPGLEDSSRFWSVAMTLEHILIVSHELAKVIETLSRGEKLLEEIEIAKVKPLGVANSEKVLQEFRDLGSNFTTELNSRVLDRRSPATHNHPWFGKLNTNQWHWLVASHVAIHRKQIQQIVKVLQRV